MDWNYVWHVVLKEFNNAFGPYIFKFLHGKGPLASLVVYFGGLSGPGACTSTGGLGRAPKVFLKYVRKYMTFVPKILKNQSFKKFPNIARKGPLMNGWTRLE